MSVLIRQGDTERQVWELGDDAGPADLSAADSVHIVVHGPKVVTDDAPPLAFDVALDVLPQRGRVAHDPDAAHWADPGWYEADFRAVWPDGSQRTFPASGPKPIQVVAVQSP